MAKINYSQEINASQMALDALKRSYEEQHNLKRAEALQATIDRIAEEQALLRKRHEALPDAIAKAESRLNALRVEAKTESNAALNAKLQKLLQLKAKIEAQLCQD